MEEITLEGQDFEDGMLLRLDELMARIRREGDRQLVKWGVQSHTLPEWMLYLAEEAGEAAQAAGDHYHGREVTADKLVQELIETATLALKIAEMMLPWTLEEIQKKQEEAPPQEPKLEVVANVETGTSTKSVAVTPDN